MVLRLRRSAPDNWRSAKCLGTFRKGDDPWFDGREEQAIQICRGAPECPLMRECLLFALTNNESSGVWGGHGEADRKAIRKRWPLRRGKQPRPEWRVFEPGEPASWYSPDELTDEDDDDDY